MPILTLSLSILEHLHPTLVSAVTVCSSRLFDEAVKDLFKVTGLFTGSRGLLSNVDGRQIAPEVPGYATRLLDEAVKGSFKVTGMFTGSRRLLSRSGVPRNDLGVVLGCGYTYCCLTEPFSLGIGP